MNYLFVFFVALIIVYLLTPEIRYFGLKFLILDRKNHRKMHSKRIIAKFGGVGIYLGFMAGVATMIIYSYSEIRASAHYIAGLVIAGSLSLLLGMYDDYQGSNANTKFSVQLLIALLLIKSGFIIQRIYVPGLLDWPLGPLSTPFTILWLVGITNAVNLIDGLDGLAGGIMVICFLFLSGYGFIRADHFLSFISLALVGSVLGFLYYNFYPAKIFMGDSGSLFLGCMIGALGTYSFKGPAALNQLFIPVAILLFIPILDTMLAIIRRVIRKQYIFDSDACHIHHFFISRGFGQVQVVVGFYIVTAMLGLFFIGMAWLR